MLWQGRRESENVEDARGSGGGGRIVLGGGIGTVILVVLYLLLGGIRRRYSIHNKRNYRNRPSSTIKRHAMRHRSSSASFSPIRKTQGMRSFVKWAGQYEEPMLVLF